MEPSAACVKAVDRVLDNEGGYANNPADPGGETKYGITKRFAQAHGYSGSIATLTREQAGQLYAAALWRPYLLDTVPFVLAYQWLDFAVNSGAHRATLELQPLLGVVVDGGFGPATRAACAALPYPYATAHALLDRRAIYLKSLPTWALFGKGWMARVEKNRVYISED